MTYCVLKNSKLPILEKHSGVWPAMMIQEINDRIQIQKLDKILDQASNFSNLWFWYLVQALFSPARGLGWVWVILIISVLLLSALSLPWVSGHLPLSFSVLKSFFSLPILHYDSIQKDWNKDVKWPRQVLFTVSGFLTTIVQWLSMATCHSAPKTWPFVPRRTRQFTPTIPVLRHCPSFPPPCLEGTPQK